MDKYTILVIIFGILILAILIILFLVNNLLLKRDRVSSMFNSVVNYLDDRMALLDEISVFILENMENEKKLATSIERASTALSKVKISSEDNLKEIKESAKLFQKFMDLEKVYPNLEKNTIYNRLVEGSKLNEERILYAMDSYNKEAAKYNEAKQSKINVIVSKVFRIKDYDYYNK